MQKDGPDPIKMEALEWFVRMRDHRATAADREAFEVWLAADEAHVAALRHAEVLWKRFDVAQPEFDRLRRSRMRLSRRKFMAGSLAFGAGLVGLYAFHHPDLFADYVTGVGERRQLALADGSTVQLGSWTALSATFTDTVRRLVLYRGEGFFQVAADPIRPFIVAAADGTTRALGTEFDVKFVDDLVTVAVSEHAVEVRAASRLGIRVEAGWQVSYGGDRLGVPIEANLEAVAAWRHGRIVFQDVPLRRVLRELERYRRGPIVLMNSSIGDIPVTAVFETREPDSALATIAATLPIRIRFLAGYVAVVYPAG